MLFMHVQVLTIASEICNSHCIILGGDFNEDLYNLDSVVQSIVSLTISLRHKFVKQISAKETNTLLFFVEKM